MKAEILLFDEYFRGSGKTTALAEAALKIGAIFVVANDAHAKELRERYPDLDVRVPNDYLLIGSIKPIIFDHFVVTSLVAPLIMKIKEIKKIVNG